MRFVVSATKQASGYGSSVIFAAAAAAVESTRLGIQASVTWDPFVLCQIRLALTAIKRGGLIFGRPDGDHYHKTNAFAVACMLPWWPLFLQSFYNTLYSSERTRKSDIKKAPKQRPPLMSRFWSVFKTHLFAINIHFLLSSFKVIYFMKMRTFFSISFVGSSFFYYFCTISAWKGNWTNWPESSLL